MSMNKVSLESLRETSPRGLTKYIDQQLVDYINNDLGEEEKDLFIDKLFENNDLIKKSDDVVKYVRAVRFIVLKLLGHTNIDAFKLVTPNSERFNNRKIANLATAFNTDKMVIELAKRVLIPDYIIRQPLRHKAFETLQEVMENSRSDLAKVQASKVVIEHTNMPEEITINHKVDDKISIIEQLRESAMKIAKEYQKEISRGNKEIIHQKVIDVEVTED